MVTRTALLVSSLFAMSASACAQVDDVEGSERALAGMCESDAWCGDGTTYNQDTDLCENAIGVWAEQTCDHVTCVPPFYQGDAYYVIDEFENFGDLKDYCFCDPDELPFPRSYPILCENPDAIRTYRSPEFGLDICVSVYGEPPSCDPGFVYVAGTFECESTDPRCDESDCKLDGSGQLVCR